ncbi:MAG: RrF2 family transcriptional regulator [Alphaproteobacteria bacterium]
MLSKKAKYALRALAVLTRAYPGVVPAHRLAQEAAVPGKFLESILVELRNARVVASKRGTVGGHTLARPAEELMVGDIVRILDGPIAPLRCASVTAFEPCSDCPDPERCALRLLMGEVRDAMSAVIDQRSLRQLSDDTYRLAQTANRPGAPAGETRPCAPIA